MRVEIICIIFFISFISIKCMDDCNSVNIYNNNETSILEVGKITYETINDEKAFTINSKDNGNVLINFFSINCDIEIKTYINDAFASDKLNNIRNNDSISIHLESNEITSSKIKVTHINKNKYSICQLVINAIYEENSSLEFKGNKPTILFFDQYLKEINISYDFTNDNFATFSFILNDIATLKIKYSYGSNTKDKIISNSNKIFLPNLSEINEDKIIKLTIKREDNNKSPILLTLKVFTDNSGPMILHSNYLNQGFITSCLKYQYFYINISKDDEGEIMLHDKREKGKLLARICNKAEYNCSADNIDGYMKGNETKNDIEFNEHKKRLNFRYNITEKCEEGCLLLITYQNDDIISENNNNTNIGYDFTLLVRIWNNEDWNTLEIINIPNNEYICGIFDQKYINHHYYSAFVSNDTEKIILQIKSNYLEAFAGQGKKKLNTYYDELKNSEKLTIQDEMIIIKSDLIRANNYISFTFRPTDFFDKELCFYFFRIFQIKNNDELILPMDSNFVNSLNTNLDQNKIYYYSILNNDYNELSLKYSIFDLNSANEIKYYIENKDSEIDISQEKLNEIISNDDLFNYTFNGEIEYNNSFNYILFRFEFELEDSRSTKKIFSTLYNNREIIKPQIYSPEIYQLENITIFDILKLTKYSLIISWVKGEGEIHNLFNNDNVFKLNKNSYNKPYSFFVENLDNIYFININKFVFFMSINYMNEKNDIKEIEIRRSISEVIEYNNNPIYYSIKNNGDTIYLNYKLLDINNDNTKFTINGMLGNESIINAIRDGENEAFKSEIKGYYDICSNNGFLELNLGNSVNKENNSSLNNFYIIKIDVASPQQKTNLLIEIYPIDAKFNKTIDIPVNQFISASYNLTEKKDYNFLFQIKGTTQKDTIIMEFSKNYKGINIEIIADSYKIISPQKKDGFEQYIFNQDYDEITSINIALNKSYNVDNKDLLKGFFMFRYYYNDTNDNDNFEFKNDFDILDKDNKNNVTLRFNSTSIQKFYNKYQIYANIFSNQKREELLKTTSFFNSYPINENLLKSNITNDSFIFNLPLNYEKLKDYNFSLIMQIKVTIDNDNDYQQNKILAYLVDLDLSELKKKGIPIYIIIAAVVIIIIIAIILIFSIVYCKMRKKNINLEKQITEFSLVKNNEEEYDDNII